MIPTGPSRVGESEPRCTSPATAMVPRPNYLALRVCNTEQAAVWWAHAHAHGHDAPPAIRALLRGRDRIELSAVELDAAIHWAAQLPGWSAGGHTLYVHVP